MCSTYSVFCIQLSDLAYITSLVDLGRDYVETRRKWRGCGTDIVHKIAPGNYLSVKLTVEWVGLLCITRYQIRASGKSQEARRREGGTVETLHIFCSGFFSFFVIFHPRCNIAPYGIVHTGLWEGVWWEKKDCGQV